MTNEILCVGEVLWDALPAGLFPGGAPFNVACHLNELAQPVTFASRVGDDTLGQEIRRRMRHRGMSDDFLQTDMALPTGFVIVSLGATTGPAYEIVEPAAWDAIEATDTLVARAKAARGIVYGSLVERNETSRGSVRQLVAGNPLRIFDVNLRPPYDTREIVVGALSDADIVKLNDAELARLASWFGWTFDEGSTESIRNASTRLAGRFGCTTVIVTRGAAGAGLWRDDVWHEHPGYCVEVADTVGSGDAFLAAFLEGHFAGWPAAEILSWANAVGAYVASQHGATPHLDRAAIDVLRAG